MGYFMTNIYLEKIAEMQKSAVDPTLLHHIGALADPAMLTAIKHSVAADIGTLQHLASTAMTHIPPDVLAAGAAAGKAGAHIVGIHAGQNVLTNAAIRTKAYQKSVAEHFAAGLGGRLAPTAAGDKTSRWTNFKTYLAGGVNPELNIMRDETYHAGHKLRSHLQEVGIDPDNMPRRAKAALARAARGDFSKLKQQYANDPLVLKTLEAAGKATGHPLVDIVKSTDAGVRMAENAWKSNVLTRGFGGQMSKRMDVSHLPKGVSSPTTADSVSGAMAAGLATGDFILTAANAGKAVLSDQALVNKSRYLRAASDVIDKHLISGTIEKNLDKGLAGKRYHPLAKAYDTVLASVPLAESRDLANRLGLAAREANVQKHVSTAKDFARDAKEIYEQGKARVNETAQTVGTGVSAASTVHKILTESAKRREAAKNAVVNQPIPEKTKMGVGGLGVGAGLAGTS